MHFRSFILGLGSGVILLSVAIYFYSNFSSPNTENLSATISDEQVIERARKLGMRYITETLSHSEALSDDDIIERAKLLGMILVEEINNNSIETEGNEMESDGAENVEVETESNETESAETANNETESAEVVNAKPQVVETTRVETKSPEPNWFEVNESEDGTSINVYIGKGRSSREISGVLYNAGVISDPDEFLSFLIENNVTKMLSFGSYNFSPGESYEAILDKFMTKKQK